MYLILVLDINSKDSSNNNDDDDVYITIFKVWI